MPLDLASNVRICSIADIFVGVLNESYKDLYTWNIIKDY